MVHVVVFTIDHRPVVDRGLSDPAHAVTDDRGHARFVDADGIGRGNRAARDVGVIRFIPEFMSEIAAVFRIQFRIIRNRHRRAIVNLSQRVQDVRAEHLDGTGPADRADTAKLVTT